MEQSNHGSGKKNAQRKRNALYFTVSLPMNNLADRAIYHPDRLQSGLYIAAEGPHIKPVSRDKLLLCLLKPYLSSLFTVYTLDGANVDNVS